MGLLIDHCPQWQQLQESLKVWRAVHQQPLGPALGLGSCVNRRGTSGEPSVSCWFSFLPEPTLLQIPALGKSWLLPPCTSGNPIREVPWLGWRSLPSDTARKDGQASLESSFLSLASGAWTTEGKGVREGGGGGGKGRRRREASCHQRQVLLKAKG